jgi:hypothetical protein
MSQLLDKIGEWNQVYTLVDFYQYIKGVEYLICLAFFISFPMFYRYLHRSSDEQNH